jgi:hypothetical protein
MLIEERENKFFEHSLRFYSHGLDVAHRNILAHVRYVCFSHVIRKYCSFGVPKALADER